MEFLHTPLLENAASHPNKIAILHEQTQVSYQKLLEKVERLREWGLCHLQRKGRVALLLENSPELVYFLYAVPASGSLCVPLETSIHERNLAYILKDCGAEAVVTSEKFLPKLAPLETDRVRVLTAEEILKEAPAKGGSGPPPLNQNDPAFILYTTGTTGPKKGVVLSHANLLAATKQINQFMRLGDWVVESLPMPLSHSFGFGRLRCVLDVGGTVLLENGLLRPEWVLHRMKVNRANAFASVPAGFSILLERFAKEFGEIGPQIRSIEIGSAFMRTSHKERLMEYCPKARLCMHYGLTEASRSTFIEFHSEKEYLHTAGRPSPGVSLRIADEKGNRLGVNTTGEILIQGKMVMQGYWNQPDLSKKAFANGWLRTGDLGRFDEKGYLHLMGRKEEIINLGGVKVAPGEVEEVLLSYHGVLEAAVVGLAGGDRITEEAVKAFLVVDDAGQFASFDGLKKHCSKELEPYKVPTVFEIVPSLPKTASGKIQRHLLRKETQAIDG